MESLCSYCQLKGPVCDHLKELMKIQLAGAGIDGSKLCPLLLGLSGEKEENKKGVTQCKE